MGALVVAVVATGAALTGAPPVPGAPRASPRVARAEPEWTAAVMLRAGAARLAAAPSDRALGLFTPAEDWARPGTTIANLDSAPGSPYAPGQRVVALTFDDGPDPRYTPEVLQVLAADHAPASFEIVGEHGALYPGLLRQEVAEGMVLVDHTWTHADLSVLPAAAWVGEVDQTDALLQSISGHPVRCLRPPQGRADAAVLGLLAARGLAELSWDVDPSDYLRPPAGQLAARVLAALHPGAVVVLHDGGGDRSQTVAALPAIVAGIRAAGYRIVPVCAG